MRIKILIILFLLSLFLFPTLAFSQIQAKLELKEYFEEWEDIKARLTIQNLGEEEKDVLVRIELSSPNYIQFPFHEFFLTLKKKEESKVEIPIATNLPPSKDYSLLIYIIAKNETIFLSKNFEVKKKEVELISCLDPNCENQTQVFYIGEKVCLSFFNSTPIIKFKIIGENEKEVKLPICLENLKRGSYQLLAFTENSAFSLNFSIIERIGEERHALIKKPPIYWALPITLFLAIVVIFLYKRKKGQVSFFIKTISIVIASIFFVLIVYYFTAYQKSIAMEKDVSEFKNEVINLAKKLIESEECLSYKSIKGTIDVNKVNEFSSKYKEVEPECAKEINFDYTITIVQIPKKVSVLPVIKGLSGTLAWIPNSGAGNSVSLVSSAGKEIRRHWTVPQGIIGDPSRTAVDSKGNAWVGNRGTNTLVKIAFDKKDCIDKNGNGVIETSEDRNNDGVVEENEMLPFDKDECIVENVRLGSNQGTKIRAVCIDRNDNVYAGHWSDQKIFYVSSEGEIIKEWKLPAPPYGCVVDEENNVWISTLTGMRIVKIDNSLNKILSFNVEAHPYGIWRGNNSVVFTTWGRFGVVKISREGKEIWKYVGTELSEPRGVLVDSDEYVYAVGSNSNNIVKLDKHGKFLKSMPTCHTPTGVSMDSEGNIWVICLDGGVRVYDKDLNVISQFTIKGKHYGYSDFTGFQTGARLGLSEVKPTKEINVERKEWSFSIGAEKIMSVESFSLQKARKSEIRMSFPVVIRYNETFATEGIIHIYAVKGELEELAGIIEFLCESAKKFPDREVKFSKIFRFSYPIKLQNGKVCMLNACKKIDCQIPLRLREFNAGEYSIKFTYNSERGEIEVV